MSEKIIQTFTTSENQLFRVRELSFTEQLTSGNKFIIEVLMQGRFVKINNPYFKSKDEASDIISKINMLDILQKRRKLACSKLNEKFEASIVGTEELEFCQLFDGMTIYDYDLNYGGEGKIIVEIGDCRAAFNRYLSKYGYSSEISSIHITDYSGRAYEVIGKGRQKEALLYHSGYLESETFGSEQYRYLLERYFNISTIRFFSY